MKKIFSLSVILLLIFSCTKDDNSSTQQEVIELKTLTVNINLPENSSVSTNDLTISSLFSENMQVSNGSTEIESFKDNTMELTFATNSQGNIVMLSYFNPLNIEMIEMNAESTALALIMLHPWSFDLTANAKEEALTYIKNLAEFESYKSIIENSISSGELNPLNTQSVLDKVTEIQLITFNRTTEYIEPLEFNVEDSTASVKNADSSASYSVGLYDENDVLFEHKLAEGLDKSHFLFSEFKNNTFQETDNDGQTAFFNIPSDGNWTLKAKSGLSFDESLENQQAAFYNTKMVVANILGLFSTNLKKLIIKSECMLALGENVYNGISGSINISSSLQSYSNGSINGYILTKDVLSFTWDRFDSVLSIIESCSSEGTEFYGLDKIKSGVFGKILGFLDVVSRLENVFNSTAMLTDWVQFDKEIEYCFVKNGNEINECLLNQLKIIDTNQILDFNDLPFSYFNENDNFCYNYRQIVSFNYDNENEGANNIDIVFSSDTNASKVTDGIYNVIDGQCVYTLVDFFHIDLFSTEDDGFIQNGTIQVSNDGNTFVIEGELIKISFDGTNEIETSLGSVIGRFISE